MPRAATIPADARELAGYLSPTPARVADLMEDTGWTRERMRLAIYDLSAQGVTIVYYRRNGTLRVVPETMGACRRVAE